MDITEAIRRAEQWRKDGACGPAAIVATALLNELERPKYTAQELLRNLRSALQRMRDDGYISMEMRAIEGWLRCYDLPPDRPLQPHPDTLAQAQSKVSDDMLAAQRNLLLREDGYPNAPVPRNFAGPAHKSAVAIQEQWYKQKLGE